MRIANVLVRGGRRKVGRNWAVLALGWSFLFATVATIFAQETEESDTGSLRSRRMAARADKNIFSPLSLPTPTRIRTAAGLPGPDYWQQQVDYQMDVVLDADNESVSAVADITYTNNSPEPLEFLWLSLEQNLFKSDSLGGRSTPPGARFSAGDEFQGGYSIQHVRSGEQDLELNVYDTLGRLELPAPLAANGGKFEFQIAWSFNIPEYGVDRMGIRKVQAGKIFQLAQWFPHVCKYDDVHGWNTLPYLGQGEFYTDFGTYDVKITAPRGHVVQGTGVLKNPQAVLTEKQLTQLATASASRQTVIIRSEDEIGTPDAAPAGEGPLTWHFQAEKVRSFAWTSSDATIWDAAAIVWEDGETVLVQSVYPVEARGAWSESTQMLRHSILHYSDKWFRYPYPTAINVNGNVGGMEYPMIIFCGGDNDRVGLYFVTSHEIGHNWFPMVVNSDERRYAWMDEGFNTFLNFYDRLEVFDEVFNGSEPAPPMPPSSLRDFGRFNANPQNQPIMLPADQIAPNMLGQLAYFKPGASLRYLREEIVGPERFDAAFQQYIRAWAFKSPQPSDFFRCMENGTGMNLDWYWRGWIIENLPLDQGIESVRQARRRNPAQIELKNLGEMVMPVTLRIEFDDDSTKDVTLPVQIWHYTNLWTATVETGGKAIKKVVIDPDRRLPDVRRTNNTWRATTEEEGASGADD
ncbi:MAG: M1 family metallopeptidase [Pirellulaceae bacterium]|nr:M1 family metallopeptidase [Pirellulaceae bacterium]